VKFPGWARAAAGRLGPPLVRLRELYPQTARGFGVVACTGAALWFYGFRALDRVWYVAGLGMILLTGVATCSVVLAAVRMKLWLARQASPVRERVHGETQRALDTGFSLPRLRFWLFIDVRLEWVEPAAADVRPAAEGAQLRERVALSDHAEIGQVLRRVVVRDVFGLASIALRRRAALDVSVLPHAGALRTLPLLRSLAGGDDVPHPLGIAQGDRIELRRYAPGDPARFIHWKVFARTQKLVVRVPERALARAHRVAAYLIAGERDAASAAAARVALEEGAFGAEFQFGADGSPTPVRALDEALLALRRSSAARERSGRELAAFVDAVEREGPASFVLFVPPVAGAAVEAVREMVQRRTHPVRVVIGIDGFLPAKPPSLLARLALLREGTSRIAIEQLREVMASYRRLNCEVVVLDRESGRVLGDAHLSQLREAPARGEAA
jgi:uncharacterized protein (DUF58 family)